MKQKYQHFKIQTILVLLLFFFHFISTEETNDDLMILGIEPNSGPISGETRVMARLKLLDDKKVKEFPHPRCRFGSKESEVEAVYVKCTPNPRTINEPESDFEKRTDICIQCGNTKPHAKDIIPFTISLLGDFTDTVNSLPFRFYVDPIVKKIFPEAGPQNGGTKVEVTGENFLNYDQNLRCTFGSREVKAIFVSSNKLICYSPPSDVVQKRMPFAVTFNFQQKSKEDINYVYYETPQINHLEPGKGPDVGGTVIKLFGQNFNPFLELPDFEERNKIRCRFDGKDEGYGLLISSTYVQCTVPPSKGRIKTIPEISLNRQDFHKNDEVAFYYYHAPYITKVFPKSIAPNGGTEVIVTGTLCKADDHILCKFANVTVKGEYMSEEQLKCISPPGVKPGKVPFAVSCKDGEDSVGTFLRCFEDPIVESIEPVTGPEHGHTQLTVRGKKFPVGCSEAIKCSFNRTILAEATVIDNETLYCFTPNVLNEDGINHFNVENYDLEVTMDEGKVFHGKKQKFEYYKQHKILSVEPNIGPVEGGTIVKIAGEDFSDLKRKNVSVRFATYNAEIIKIEPNLLTVRSPKANYTGPSHIQIAFNGQQFNEKNHNENNTFTYHKWPHLTHFDKLKGSTNSANDITISGLNFIKAYDTNRDNIEVAPENSDTIYYRFVNVDNDKDISIVQEKKPNSNEELEIKTPVEPNTKKVNLELSYNKQNYRRYKDYEYEYLKIPQIKSINPEYVHLREAGKKTVTVRLEEDYYCPDEKCRKFKCKYESDTAQFVTEGTLETKDKVICATPKVRNPEAYNFEVMPGDKPVYTNSGKNFTYYNPYVMKVVPPMIPSKGGSELEITGYGFANTGEELLSLFGAEKLGDGLAINCNKYSCKQQAEYIDSQHVKTRSVPRKIVRLNETGEKLEWQRFPVEVAVLEGDFTNNNVTIFYYDEPTIIEDLYSGISDDSIYNLTEKDKLNPALIKSLPANTETYIPIPIDGSAIKGRYEEMEPYFNFSCKYTMENSEQEKIRKGVLTSFPHGTNKFNLFLCETPNWNEVGKSEVRISLNGYDYTDDSYKIEFTDPLYVSQMNPTCGPIEGNTEVEFIGTGFRDEDDFYFKWGPQNIVPMRDQFFFKDATDAEKNKFGLSSSPYRVKKMKVHSPMALHKDNTTGGPDYLSIDKVNLLPLNELLEDYNLNSYKNQKFEYYYYHQVYVDSYYPNSADPSDPAIITVLGAFFLDKPEYNVKPVCKFGNKEVIGTYKSNVRITCLSPEYNKANLKVPFSVSLNGKDFIKAEEPFTFLSALKNANFGKIQPQVGPINGGTIVNIPARGLGKILQSENNTYDDDSEEEDEKTTNDIEVVKCMFQSYENEGIKKEAPGKIEKNNDGSNSIVCTTPGGWTEATKTKVFANFGGDNWVTTANDFFFYDLEDLQPASGPNIGGGYISLNGGGFMKQENTKLALENVPHDAVSTEGNLIQFPLPPSVKSGYVGPADVAISMDGANQVEINEGFYYYEQVNVSSFYPITGPAKGNGKIIVSGKNFRSDFKRANPGCKIGNYYGQGEVLNSDEMVCTFDQFPVLRSKPGKPTEEDEGFDFSVALNNYSFVNSEDGKKFKGYTIHHIEPSSGPISGGTRILIHGSGFSDTGMQRCRFGTPGWFAITQAEYLDPNTLSCISPADFKIPKEGQLPFNVPFSVGLTEDEFEPWTTTSHTFTFYRNPKLIDNDPIEGKTSEIKPVLIRSDKNGTFTVPSPIIFEEIYDVIGDNESHASDSKFEYQPIKCKYGRFGVTSATYINETHITCLTPHIANDKDIGYEKVDLEVALNGEDFIKGEDVTYTFIGPAANRMVWVYILMILFIAILAVILILLATTFLNTGNKDEGSQVRNKRIRYLIDQNLEEGSDAVLRQGDGVL